MTDTSSDGRRSPDDLRDEQCVAGVVICAPCGHAKASHEGSIVDEFASAHGGTGVASCAALVRHGEQTRVCGCRIRLGSSQSGRPQRIPEARPTIATIPSPGHRLTTVRLVCHEVTTLDPIHHQPDFEQITIEYVPDRHLVESRSLKAYWRWWRNHGTSMDGLATLVAEDVAAATLPWQVMVTVEEAPRGGIAIVATASVTRQRPGSEDREPAVPERPHVTSSVASSRPADAHQPRPMRVASR